MAPVPAAYREAVFLVAVEGFSYKEVAEIMGTPVGTVMSRLHRGRKMLRESLREYAIEKGFLKADESLAVATHTRFPVAKFSRRCGSTSTKSQPGSIAS